MSETYELLDFGDGRRLERFGPLVLDRPCPAAEPFERANAALWTRVDARFDRRDQEKGRWTTRGTPPERWTIARGPLRFELKRTEVGHVGLFPEQGENWDWLRDRFAAAGTAACGDNGADAPSAAQHKRPRTGPSLKVLNLFAYTGGSTLAAAAAGAEVVHVDAAANVVAWARRNAELSGLADAPIRWIVEDAMNFVRREQRRGNRYDAVILDPPSYGHGPKGQPWQLSQHLAELLSLCRRITGDRLEFLLMTAHTPEFDAERLAAMVRQAGFPVDAGRLEAKPLAIPSADGRRLPSGTVVRWKCGAGGV